MWQTRFSSVTSKHPTLGAINGDGLIAIVRQHCIGAMSRRCCEPWRLLDEVMRLSLNSDTLGFTAFSLKVESNQRDQRRSIQQREGQVHLGYLRLKWVLKRNAQRAMMQSACQAVL
jgi:hypothetical protein